MMENIKVVNSSRLTFWVVITVLILFFTGPEGFGQCEKRGVIRDIGIANATGICAPVTYDLKVKYEVQPGSQVEFFIDWADGTTETINNPPLVGTSVTGGLIYEAVVPHLYDDQGTECDYLIETYVVIDGVQCPDSRFATEVSVWDKDNKNGGELSIGPTNEYRVCWGASALVTFQDNSTWNCVPASGHNDNPNDRNRWFRWVYGTGNASNRIPNIEVGGIALAYPYNGMVEYEPGPILNPTSNSQAITVPVTTAADVGKEFWVDLQNWNVCNPYDTDVSNGWDTPLSGSIDGDNPAIVTRAKIIIVDKAQPDFVTKDMGGAIKTEFCVGEDVQLQNLTPDISGAKFNYSWELYDDATGSLEKTFNKKNPKPYSFSNPGVKRIKLTVTDSNSEGNCNGSIEKMIVITETAEAAIQVSDINGDPLSPLCYDLQPKEVVFRDVSTNFNPISSTWTWKFYDETGSEVASERKSGAFTQDSIAVSLINPGTYMAELIASASGVDCETRDTAYVHIYHPPTADFSFVAGCQSDSVELMSSAVLSTVVNGDKITTYEWDLDNDGIFETTGKGPFNYLFPAPGTYDVHHRVVTEKGACSDQITQPVTVQASPYASFTPDVTEGCAPLNVSFTVDTLLANQPVGVDDYIWHVKDLEDNSVQQHSFSLANTSELTFYNSLASFDDHQYQVWLEIKATNGCDVISDTTTITVFASPPSEFIITNLSGGDTNCSPRTYNFEVAATTQALSPDEYVWTIFDHADSSIVFSETISASDPTLSHTLTNNEPFVKQYRVRLQPIKTDACFEFYEELVSVIPAPSSAFDVLPLHADCQLVTYKVEAQQKGLFYQWQVDPIPMNNPDYTKDTLSLVYPKDVSAYSIAVSLQTVNVISCSSQPTTQTITIDPQEQINASFIVSPSITEVPNTTITLTNHTSPGEWSYEWDFGDGTISQQANPGEHTYATYGEYTIRLKATGKYCYEEDSAKVIIKQTIPRVSFDYSTIEGCLPLEVNFVNTTQYADSSSILWNFGDGTTSTDWNPSHTYNTSGIYTVSLQASNELGIVVTEEQALIIDLSQGPKADFKTRLAQRYLRDEDVFFSNQSQRSEFYFWDFGDGTTSTEENPVHRYSDVGYYDITLIASNSLSCSDTLTKQLFIEPLVPEVDFTYEPPKGCRPLTVQFRNLSRYADADSYRWSFGEGEGVSTEENPVYTYYEPGIYTVSLEASNSIGVTVAETKEFSVEVYETPGAYFNLRPEKAFLGEPIYLVNLSYGAKKYYWDFGDGTTSTDPNPSHTYPATGSYDITLIAESEHGCTDTLVIESAVLIEDGGKVQVPNAFTPSEFGPTGSEVMGSDGTNDVFLPVFEGVTKFHMMIYNRWGELMFESFDKYHGWNGYYKGKLCPKDAYVYKLEIKFSDGNHKTIVGDVTLVR